MAQPGFIKFDPEKIGSIAQQLDTRRKAFTANLSEAKRRSDSLRGVWQSDGADEYISKAAEFDAQGNQLAQMMGAFINSLNQAAGIYKKSETDAKRTAEVLNTDGVFRV